MIATNGIVTTGIFDDHEDDDGGVYSCIAFDNEVGNSKLSEISFL